GFAQMRWRKCCGMARGDSPRTQSKSRLCSGVSAVAGILHRDALARLAAEDASPVNMDQFAEQHTAEEKVAEQPPRINDQQLAAVIPTPPCRFHSARP